MKIFVTAFYQKKSNHPMVSAAVMGTGPTPTRSKASTPRFATCSRWRLAVPHAFDTLKAAEAWKKWIGMVRALTWRRHGSRIQKPTVWVSDPPPATFGPLTLTSYRTGILRRLRRVVGRESAGDLFRESSRPLHFVHVEDNRQR